MKVGIGRGRCLTSFQPWVIDNHLPLFPLTHSLERAVSLKVADLANQGEESWNKGVNDYASVIGCGYFMDIAFFFGFEEVLLKQVHRAS
jgi:hypothetical protein